MMRDSQYEDADGRLWPLVSSSRIAGHLRAAAGLVQRSRTDSRAIGAALAVGRKWRNWSNGERYQFVGAACLMGSAAHVWLSWSSHPPGGWWLILPVLTAMYGAVTLGLGIAAARQA